MENAARNAVRVASPFSMGPFSPRPLDGVQRDDPVPTLLTASPNGGTLGTEMHIVGNDFRSGSVGT